jgi:hypothetical protein
MTHESLSDFMKVAQWLYIPEKTVPQGKKLLFAEQELFDQQQ